MDIKTLQWFQEICRCGSITKAASNLFITPQGLSRGIKALEGELGVPLLERTPNGVLLTPYGECLLRHAKPLLEENRELCAEIKKMRQQERGLLRVCSAYGVFRIMGPDFVLNFEQENPGMSLDYMEYPDAYVQKEILAGNYDIGFGIGPINSRELELMPLFSSQVSLLVYEGHPLADRETASFSDLAGEPLILESHMFKIHDLVKESCRRAGFEANIIYCTSGFSLCHKLTAQKRGISVIVNRISEDMSKQGLKVIPLEDSFSWEVFLICRITPKALRGICGCNAHGIAGRNFLRFTAGGAATHSDHGREICHTLHTVAPDGNYKVKDPEKLLRIAKEWGVETEGKDIYDLAHEMSELALLEYGKPFGVQRWLKRAPEHTQKLWHDAEIEPRAIDREVSTAMHMTHMGNSCKPEALVRQALRSGMSDGWGGSMCGTEFSDVMFGTPKPVDTEANLGVMKEDMVNIIVHGHDPSLSEMICDYSEDPEMIELAKSVGAKGINVAGVCCTSNEVAMRRGIPMAGNFLQQENVVLTGACEAIVVDVQCIFPALGPLSKCFHTKFITTSPIAQMPDSEFIRFSSENAGENAKKIVRTAVENFVNRKPELVYIPKTKQKATVGFSVEAIIKALDRVSDADTAGTTKPLIDCITSGAIRGVAAMVGCNNPRVRADQAHIELMKKMIANDVLVILSGCSAQAAARAGLMDKEARNLCGAGLKRVCELLDIPPVLHMGSCVDISRMVVLASRLAKDSGLNISQLPLVGCAPEWMSEKAVSIGNYVVATGIDTFLGVEPQVTGSDQMVWWLTEGIRDWVEAAYTIETDIEKLGDAMLARIDEKRAALGI